ncbi:hypothetical protein VOLCADRAFT_102717 [Volvox carteri f. nagariensis]|uniref:Uncharacterized protein n=1 Tax=Volvox carteri f. nagariensis TaxID=3068 RepID=D8THM6_VOLCA|nr:uncharacterized protein VOLCADRAFT_102717 [Volvox carteri f. nagariensis]EFJ53095.1 hypothetical protein VOLCADRAFT_102717 [Volvox carteri f. nagariensis]|eukprot:XP_002946100.1 hypothetical protein VOLCADRAFT_102717 [Volvox carteri f. nagariensis]
MEPQTVSEIPFIQIQEGVLARLFYTAGAVAGLAGGVLEVMTKLLHAAVQVAIANAAVSTHGSKNPSQVTPTAPRAFIADGTWTYQATSNLSDAASGECTLAVPNNTPAAQHDPNATATAELVELIGLGAIVCNAALSDTSGGCGVTEVAPEATVIPTVMTVDADADETADNDPDDSSLSLSAATPEGEASTSVEVPAPLATSGLSGDAAEPLEEPILHSAPFIVSSPVNPNSDNEAPIHGNSLDNASGLGSVGPAPVVEPEQAFLLVPELVSGVTLQPDNSQLLSASRVVAGMREGDEAMRNESGQSGIMAVSCGTAGLVDPVRDAPTSRKLKTASASVSTTSSASMTPGVSYTQRLEGKRQSSRRKGAHKAKAH